MLHRLFYAFLHFRFDGLHKIQYISRWMIEKFIIKFSPWRKIICYGHWRSVINFLWRYMYSTACGIIIISMKKREKSSIARRFNYRLYNSFFFIIISGFIFFLSIVTTPPTEWLRWCHFLVQMITQIFVQCLDLLNKRLNFFPIPSSPNRKLDEIKRAYDEDVH